MTKKHNFHLIKVVFIKSYESIMVATDKIHKNSQEKQRAIWSNSFDFFLSAVGYAGN